MREQTSRNLLGSIARVLDPDSAGPVEFRALWLYNAMMALLEAEDPLDDERASVFAGVLREFHEPVA